MINGIQWDHICSRTGVTLEDIARVIYPGADKPLRVFLDARRAGTLLDEMDIAKVCSFLRVTPNELFGYENISVDAELYEYKVEAYRVILNKKTGEVRLFNKQGVLYSEMIILGGIMEIGPYLNDLVMIGKHREKYSLNF